MNQTVVVFLKIRYFGVSKKSEYGNVKTVDELYAHKILRVTKERKYFFQSTPSLHRRNRNYNF